MQWKRIGGAICVCTFVLVSAEEIQRIARPGCMARLEFCTYEPESQPHVHVTESNTLSSTATSS